MAITEFPINTKVFSQLDEITDDQATDSDGVMFFDESSGVMKRITRGELFKNKVIPIDSVADFPALDTDTYSDRQQFSLGSFAPDGESGGGIMLWEPDLPKSLHDGVNYFSPTVPIPADFDNPTDVQNYMEGVGEEWPAGDGIFVLNYLLSLSEFNSLKDRVSQSEEEINDLDVRVTEAESDIADLDNRQFDTPAQAALSSLPVGAKYSTKGADAVGDGGHGDFIVSATAPTTEDGYSCFEHANGTFGVLQPVNGCFNLEQFGAVGLSGVSDTVAIQRAVDASALRKVALIATKQLYCIGASGGTTGGMGYGVMLRSGSVLKSYNRTVFKAIGNEEFNPITTSREVWPPEPGVDISGFFVDGDSLNRTTNNGMNIFISRQTGVKIKAVTSINSTSWGWCIDRCDGVDISFSHSTQIDGLETNADGFHFVDTVNVIADNMRIVSDSDDAFIIEAINIDVYNYNVSNLYAKATKARGIAIIVDDVISTVSRNISNVKINAICEDCGQAALNMKGGKYSGINIDMLSRSCRFGVGLEPGLPTDTGFIDECTINATIINPERDGVFSDPTNGTFSNNSIDVSVKNPGDGWFGASLYGDFWSGSIDVSYATVGFTDPKNAISLRTTNSNLSVSSKGGRIAIVFEAEAANNVVHLGNAIAGTVGAVTFASGSDNNSIIGGIVSGAIVNNSASTTNLFYGTKGAVSQGIATVSPNGSGDVVITHNIGTAPRLVFGSVISSAELFCTPVARSSTTATYRLRTASTGAIVTTGSYTMSYLISF